MIQEIKTKTKPVKNTAAVLMLVAAVAFGAAGLQEFDNTSSEAMEWHGEVTKVVYDENGNVVHNETSENLITDEGRNYLRDIMTGTYTSQAELTPDYIGLANTSSFNPTASDGYLADEIEDTGTNLTRKQASLSTTTTGCFEASHTFKADDTVSQIRGAGLFVSDETTDTQVDGNVDLIAEQKTSQTIHLQDGYEFEVTWEVCFN